LQRAVQLEQELAGRLARLKVEKGDLEAERVQLRELERDAATRRAVYESFLLRARQTGQQRSLSTANVSVISTAYPPLLPMGPSRASIAIAGTVLGFLAGIGIGGAMGAVESLRENMGARRSAPTGTPNGGGSSRPYRSREDDGDDFDPPPGRGPGTRRYHARSEPLQGRPEAPRSGSGRGYRSTAGTKPERKRAETVFRPVVKAPLATPASVDSGAKPAAPPRSYGSAAVHTPPVWPAPTSSAARGRDDAEFPDGEPDTAQIDHIRQRLRAFRREIDELSERRTRRAG